MYLAGEAVELDVAEGVKWLEAAADQGMESARRALEMIEEAFRSNPSESS